MERVNVLIREALDHEFTDPRLAIEKLWEVVNSFPSDTAVLSVALDALIRISAFNKEWDEAIKACRLAQQSRPEYRKAYSLEEQACVLEKEGKVIEATEVRLKIATLHGKWYGDIREFGDRFAALGKHDRAWRLYNEAVNLAVEQGYSPHSIRQSMAKLLQKEGKFNQAVETLLIGVYEAGQFSKRGVPKSLVKDLCRAFRMAGVKDKKQIDPIISLCLEGKWETAIKEFRRVVHDLRG